MPRKVDFNRAIVKEPKVRKNLKLAEKVWRACEESNETDPDKLYAEIAPKMGFISAFFFGPLIKLFISLFVDMLLKQTAEENS